MELLLVGLGLLSFVLIVFKPVLPAHTHSAGVGGANIRGFTAIELPGRTEPP